MSKSYKINVNESFDFDISDTEISKLNAITTSKNSYHVLHENTSYKTEIVSSELNKKTYQVKVNNNVYNVHINNELDLLIKDMGFEIGSSKLVDEIKAPMPGLILEINIKIGQEIK